MAKLGRPSKLCPEVKEKLLQALKLGASVKMACEAVGMPYSTVKDWISRGKGEHPTRKSTPEHAAFAADVIRAISEGKMIHLSNISVAAPKDWRASAWWLERVAPEQFANTTRIALQVEKAVEERLDSHVDKQINLLYSSIADDPDIPDDVKRKIFEHGASLGEKKDKALVN